MHAPTGLGPSRSRWTTAWTAVVGMRPTPGVLGFSRALIWILGMALGMWGAWRATVGGLTFAYRNISAYDEGVLLTGANQLLWGKLPYLDFYTNYPPGIFLLIAGAFKVVGVSVGAERAVGLALHLAVGAAAGKIAGRLLGRRFSWIAAALVLTWIEPVGIVAYTWFAGLALALLACDAWGWACQRHQRAAYAIAGAILGLTSWFRHDLFLYLTCGLGAVGSVWSGLALRRGDREPLRQALWGAAGALSVAALMWLPVFALAGFKQVAHDIYFDQVRYTMPARVLPLPSLFELGLVDWSPLELPAFLRDPFASAVFVTFTGPVLAATALLVPRAAGIERRAETFWLAVLSVAVLPQMLGRTDFWHAIFTVAPAIAWGWVWLRGGPVRRWPVWKAWPLAALGFLLLYVPRQFNLPESLWPPPYRPDPQPEPPAHLSRAGNTFVDDTRQGVLAFVNEYTRPGEPIYVGLTDHQWTFSNDMDLYFLTDRVGATRYMQFDPNLTNREDVQEQMIVDLERTRPKVAILSEAPQRRDEPNESQNSGASLLDDYFVSHYAEERRAGHFVLAVRKPDAALPGAP